MERPKTAEVREGDEERMLAFVAGDRSAFEELFGRYRKRIYNYLLRYVGDRAAAEDLFQSTFVRVVEARDRYRPTAAFSTWIYTIATNLARDHLRRASHHAEVVVDGFEGSDPSGPAEASASRAELRERVIAAVRALPAESREAVLLGKFEGRSYEEIAGIQGSTVGAVKVRIHRALRALREHLGEHSDAM